MRVNLNIADVQLTTQELTVLCWLHVEITVNLMRFVYKQIHILNVKVCIYTLKHSHIGIYNVIVSPKLSADCDQWSTFRDVLPFLMLRQLFNIIIIKLFLSFSNGVVTNDIILQVYQTLFTLQDIIIQLELMFAKFATAKISQQVLFAWKQHWRVL